VLRKRAKAYHLARLKVDKRNLTTHNLDQSRTAADLLALIVVHQTKILPAPSPHPQNRILRALSDADAAGLRARLELVDLPRRRMLEQRGRALEYVTFIETGLASVVCGAPGQRGVEIAMVGREGLCGLGVALGVAPAAFDIAMQVAGAGRRIPARAFAQACEQSPTLRHAVLRYAHAFTHQVARTSMCNARFSIEQRLARWLLMARDRLDGDEIRLTHEFLSTILCVRRAGVSTAVKRLQTRGLIDLRRGVVVVRDRAGLEASCAGAYGDAERRSST